MTSGKCKLCLSGSLQPQFSAAPVEVLRIGTQQATDMESPQRSGYVNSGQMSSTSPQINGAVGHHFPQHRSIGRGDQSASTTIGREERGGRRNAPAGIAQVQQTLALPDLQLNHVTVYTDRAELCRTITPVFKAGEIVEVLFDNVSSAIDKDSVRVELRGAATILDVTYTARSLPDLEETWAQHLADLQTELRHCRRLAESLQGKLQRLEKQHLVLDNFADGLTKQTAANEDIMALPPLPPQVHIDKHDKSKKGAEVQVVPVKVPSTLEVNRFDPSHMDTLQRFLSVYEDQAERLDTNLLATKEELETKRLRIEQIEKELAESDKRQEDHFVREISVLIEPREDGPVEMLITYVVTRCCWKPAYDIRLFNSDGSMKIIYYGMVQQTTGEDWEPRRMTLSTAQPSSEGLVPTLGLQRIHYKQSDRERPVDAKQKKKSGKPPPPPSAESAFLEPGLIAEGDVAVIGNYLVTTLPRQRTYSYADSERRTLTRNRSQLSRMEESPRISGTPVQTLQRAASSFEGTQPRGSSLSRATSRQALGTSLLLNSGLSLDSSEVHPAVVAGPNGVVPSGGPPVATVVFEVPRPPAIVPCTNEEVRVTVGLIDIQPQYDYVTVPKRSLSTFLKAHAKNSSNFYILPGQTNIYSDNTFIGKSELGAVAPGEEFSCNLGAEGGIEVIYRPMFKTKDSGSGQKTSVNFKQIVDVHNTFQRPVRVMVVDQLPSSGEDKIKVTLLEPNIKHPEKYDRSKPIRMNKNNNIEWDLDLLAGETKELVLRYTVEYPTVEELEVSIAEP